MTKGILFAAALVAAVVNGGIEIPSDYPGGNVKVLEIDEANGVVRVAPDLRDTRGKWFHFDFTLRGAFSVGSFTLRGLAREWYERVLQSHLKLPSVPCAWKHDMVYYQKLYGKMTVPHEGTNNGRTN